MTSRKYFVTSLVGLALLAGCMARDSDVNRGPIREQPGYERDTTSSDETQKKAKGSSSASGSGTSEEKSSGD